MSWVRPSVPCLLTSLLFTSVWAGLRLKPATDIPAPKTPPPLLSPPHSCIHHLAAGSDYQPERRLISPPQTAAGLWLIDGLSPGGGTKKFVLMQEWKRCAPLVCVAIECTVIRPHRSVLLGPGYDLENTHCNDCIS